MNQLFQGAKTKLTFSDGTVIERDISSINISIDNNLPISEGDKFNAPYILGRESMPFSFNFTLDSNKYEDRQVILKILGMLYGIWIVEKKMKGSYEMVTNPLLSEVEDDS